MFVTIDNRVGNSNQNVEFLDADAGLALSQLDLLDGVSKTLLTLERDDGVQINIGGGPYNYIVTWSSSSDETYTLTNVNAIGDKVIELCAGGQHAEFPEEIVVSKSLALDALRRFYENKEKSLKWL